jgi:thiamine pyrophosphate-dependent acetolactate synthase large subunit-like protein
VCGTAGPGVTHLFNGWMDALKEGAPIIAIAGDVGTSLIDTAGLEELNPYLRALNCRDFAEQPNPSGSALDQKHLFSGSRHTQPATS